MGIGGFRQCGGRIGVCDAGLGHRYCAGHAVGVVRRVVAEQLAGDGAPDHVDRASEPAARSGITTACGHCILRRLFPQSSGSWAVLRFFLALSGNAGVFAPIYRLNVGLRGGR